MLCSTILAYLVYSAPGARHPAILFRLAISHVSFAKGQGTMNMIAGCATQLITLATAHLFSHVNGAESLGTTKMDVPDLAYGTVEPVTLWKLVSVVPVVHRTFLGLWNPNQLGAKRGYIIQSLLTVHSVTNG